MPNLQRSEHSGENRTVESGLLSELQGGRNNYKSYALLYDTFLQCDIKKSVFEQRVTVATHDSTVCTGSEEAFALLLLEQLRALER
jgi:hypothetical protein